MCDHSAKVIAKALSNCVDVYTPSAFPKEKEQGMDMKTISINPWKKFQTRRVFKCLPQAR